MNLKCTGFGSRVLAEEFCRNVLTNYRNLRTFQALHCFQGLSRSWKNGQFFSRTFKALWPPCIKAANTYISIMYNYCKICSVKMFTIYISQTASNTPVLFYYKTLTAGTHFDISAAPSSEYFYTWIITEKSCSTCH